MKNVIKIAIFSMIFILFSCESDENNNIISNSPKPYAVQYPIDIEKIETYLDSHYIESLSPEFDIVIKPKSIGSSNLSIKEQTQYPILSKTVFIENIPHNIYYISFRNGINSTPNSQSTVKCAYVGYTLDNKIFDSSNNATFRIDKLISGFMHILPLFKSGNYSENSNMSINVSSDFGAGIMFLPSAMAYYNQSPSNLIPAYSPLIFSFKLRHVVQ